MENFFTILLPALEYVVVSSACRYAGFRRSMDIQSGVPFTSILYAWGRRCRIWYGPTYGLVRGLLWASTRMKACVESLRVFGTYVLLLSVCVGMNGAKFPTLFLRCCRSSLSWLVGKNSPGTVRASPYTLSAGWLNERPLL